MIHVAIITGISGAERYLGRAAETDEAKQAQRFRTPDAAQEAAQRHILTHPRVIQRHLSYRVEVAA